MIGIMSALSALSALSAQVAKDHPAYQINENYFQMSGTSQAAAVSGVAALLRPGLKRSFRLRLRTACDWRAAHVAKRCARPLLA